MDQNARSRIFLESPYQKRGAKRSVALHRKYLCQSGTNDCLDLLTITAVNAGCIANPHPFSRRMRFLVLICSIACLVIASRAADPSPTAHEATPPILAEALKRFRTEGPRGWSFTQTTSAEGHSRVERYDAAQPDFNRWSLLREDGHEPTADQRDDYREKLSRRSRGGTAPPLLDQLDFKTLTVVEENSERVTYRCPLKPSESGDETAKHLVATLALHKPTHTIESFELASREPFAPTFGVRIAEMQTRLTYSLPEADRPSFLLKNTTRLRGRAFWFKSLDADMVVTFTDYERATKRK